MHKPASRVICRGETELDAGRVPPSVPAGLPAQAVRIYRAGLEPAVVPLRREREYQIGRSEKADLFFNDARVSRQHGLLYYSARAGAWSYRHCAINSSYL